jgi:type I restriction-modification system DNA methylase subunit
VTVADALAAQRYGEVFTRRWVVDVLLDLTDYTADRDLGALTLVEPAAGSGAFLLPAVERLMASATRHGRTPESLMGSVRAWEVQPAHALKLRRAVAEVLIGHGLTEALADRLIQEWIVDGDFLLCDTRVTADVVVGNPPYIRLEDVPNDVAGEYRSRWRTMGGWTKARIGAPSGRAGLRRRHGRRWGRG